MYDIPTWTEMNYQIDSEFDAFSLSNQQLNHKEKRCITLIIKHPLYKFDPIINLNLDTVKKTKVTKSALLRALLTALPPSIKCKAAMRT